MLRFIAVLFLAMLLPSALMAQSGDQQTARQDQGELYRISATSGGQTHVWDISLAGDPESRSRGLMFVRQLPPKSGMLFRFDETREVSMWMKNTFIPLDMVFLDDAGIVQHIHREAVPQSLDIISSIKPVRFVLEINGGEAARLGLRVQQQMQHPWFSGAQKTSE